MILSLVFAVFVFDKQKKHKLVHHALLKKEDVPIDTSSNSHIRAIIFLRGKLNELNISTI